MSVYDTRYPAISDLRELAKKRLPCFVFEYVDAAVDEEIGKHRNREALHEVELTPRYLRDVSRVDLAVDLFGKSYSMPFGVPPVGLGNLIWPGAESVLARACQQAAIPYIQSLFSTTLLEDIPQLAPDVCWFQLYVPRDERVMEDLISRVRKAGFHVLVVTIDVPVGAKRNRELKNGLKLPFQITPAVLWHCLIHPRWTMQTIKAGMPGLVNIMPYADKAVNDGLASFFTQFIMPGVTRERLGRIRELWDGPLVIKGIQHPQDALDVREIGVDGLIVSNHGGRQIDAAPASISSLRRLPKSLADDLTIMIDSGIRSGLDVLRAKALGAVCAFSGRSFFYGMGALGAAGAQQVIGIFEDEIRRSLQQLGCSRFSELDDRWLSCNDLQSIKPSD